MFTGTEPRSDRAQAETAVSKAKEAPPYFVDADHTNLGSVDALMGSGDFFPIDVANYCNTLAVPDSLFAFTDKHRNLAGAQMARNYRQAIEVTDIDLRSTVAKFPCPIAEAGQINRRTEERKSVDTLAVEVSVDETDAPQTPAEVLTISAVTADEEIPAQTIAPRFTGRFSKVVDYVGDLDCFHRKFDADLGVLAHAIDRFILPKTLRISAHSGSDKFSIFPVIGRLVAKHNAGLHLKTAGATRPEEVAGLAEAGGSALQTVRDIYPRANSQPAEMVKPYAPAVDIEISRLPSVDKVRSWKSAIYLGTLVHNQSCPEYTLPRFGNSCMYNSGWQHNLDFHTPAHWRSNTPWWGSECATTCWEKHFLLFLG